MASHGWLNVHKPVHEVSLKKICLYFTWQTVIITFHFTCNCALYMQREYSFNSRHLKS